jgi:hypothetical protein
MGRESRGPRVPRPEGRDRASGAEWSGEWSAGPLLLVCFGFNTLHYRVLRCAADVAGPVHVLGTAPARWLAASRYCASFTPAPFLEGSPAPELAAAQVDRIAAALTIDRVVPGDGPAVHLLARMRPHMRARSFPVPDAATFETLADKWRFGELCGALGVRHPHGRLLERSEEVAGELERGGLELPIVVKPIDQSGGRGVRVLRSARDVAAARSLRYSPVLAQPFVDGQDISLSAFCRAGDMKTAIVYLRPRGDCLFTANAEFADMVARILRHVGYEGSVNFDARLDRQGRIHILECNPRFWYTMDMALLAGVNFVGIGLAGGAGRPTSGALIKTDRSLLRSLGAPWTLTSADMATLRHRLRDPVPVLYERLDKLRGRFAPGRF